MADLACLVSSDAGLTSKVLGAASTCTKSGPVQLISVEQSLAVLGWDMIQALVINESLSQLSDSEEASGAVDLRHFWDHSVMAATIARLIAEKTRYPHVEEAYLAGLLHDVGRLVLLASDPKEYGNLFFYDGEDLCSRERDLLHTTHYEIGAKLVEQWHLDSFLSDSILYHHEPIARLEKAHPLIRIVRLAHTLASAEQYDAALGPLAVGLNLKLSELYDIRVTATAQATSLAHTFDLDFRRTEDAALSSALPLEPATLDQGQFPLSREVGNLMLAMHTRHTFSRAQGEEELLEAVVKSARLLLPCKEALLMLPSETGEAFVTTSVGKYGRSLTEFSVPVDSDSRIANDARQGRLSLIDRRTTIDGKSVSLGVIETQALRLLNAESLVCIPLGDQSRCMGILLLALGAVTPHEFQQRRGFLQIFGRQVGTALKSLAARRDEMSRQTHDVVEQYRASARRAAHEVSNPLAIIKNYLTVLDRKVVSQQPVSAEISLLNGEIDRILHIMHGLCEYQPTLKSKATEVGGVIQHVVELFQQTQYLPASVKLIVSQPDPSFEIDTDVDLLKQILMNLIKNAIEAVSEGGEIEIGSGGLANRDGELYVALWIKDTGAGIPRDMMASLFSPVQSTKGEGHRGLGLSIVYTLVKQIEGFITCRSGKEGTTFELLLPVSRTAPQPRVSHQQITSFL